MSLNLVKTASAFQPLALDKNPSLPFHHSLPTQHCFSLFDHITEPLFYFNQNLDLVYLNKPAVVFFQKTCGRQRLTGENVLSLLPPNREEAFLQEIRKVLHGQPVEYEMEIVATNTWVYCKYFPSFSGNGEINGGYGIVKNISEKKFASVDSLQSQQLFEQFMQNSPLVAWLTDKRGVIRYMNPVYQKSYGFTEADFGKSVHELFEGPIAIDYHLNNQQVINTGEAMETIEKGVKANGDVQVLKIYKFPLWVNNERMVGGWGVDITNQTELQKKLIKSVERHEYVNEATSDVIYDWDFTTGLFYQSSRFEELFGHTKNEVSLRFRLKRIHPDDLPNFKEAVFNSLRNEATAKWETEYRYLNAAGEYQNVLDKAFIIRQEGKVKRVIGALRDVTAQKNLQQRLIDQEKQNKQELVKFIIDTQEKERRQLSVELHDNVNQMLASCKLMLEVALENNSNAKLLTEEAYQSIQTVINEIRRISHDLNPSAIVDVGLVEAIEQLIEKINVAGKINIVFRPNKRHYKCYLREEDKIAVFRIVQEQLNNILKHANATEVLIRLDVHEGIVCLCIKDNGSGFDLAKTKKGLGLRNIYNRVEYYGGTINIATSAGKGCDMCITLKITSIKATERAEASA